MPEPIFKRLLVLTAAAALTACGGGGDLTKQLDPRSYFRRTGVNQRRQSHFAGDIHFADLTGTVADSLNTYAKFVGWTIALIPKDEQGGRTAPIGRDGKFVLLNVEVHRAWTLALFDEKLQLMSVLAMPSPVAKKVEMFFVPGQPALPPLKSEPGRLKFANTDGLTMHGALAIDQDGDGLADGLTVRRATPPPGSKENLNAPVPEDRDGDGVPNSLDPANNACGEPDEFSTCHWGDWLPNARMGQWRISQAASRDLVRGASYTMRLMGLPGSSDRQILRGPDLRWNQIFQPCKAQENCFETKIALAERDAFSRGGFLFADVLTNDQDNGNLPRLATYFVRMPVVSFGELALKIDPTTRLGSLVGEPFKGHTAIYSGVQKKNADGDWEQLGLTTPAPEIDLTKNKGDTVRPFAYGNAGMVRMYGAPVTVP